MEVNSQSLFCYETFDSCVTTALFSEIVAIAAFFKQLAAESLVLNKSLAGNYLKDVSDLPCYSLVYLKDIRTHIEALSISGPDAVRDVKVRAPGPLNCNIECMFYMCMILLPR